MSFFNMDTGVNLPWGIKVLIAFGIDIVDGLFGIIGSIIGLPVASAGPTLFDAGIQTPAAVFLCGKNGLIAAWEIVSFSDIGNTADSFVPTVGLITLYTWWTHRNDVIECPDGQVWDENIGRCVIDVEN